MMTETVVIVGALDTKGQEFAFVKGLVESKGLKTVAVAFNLIAAVVEDIRAGQMTAHGGALKLARPCECGIFGPARAEQLLEAMANG